MLFHFPDLETLRLALTSGIVPAAVALSPLQAAFAEGIWIETAATSPKRVLTDLRRLGVEVGKNAAAAPLEAFCCWPQLLPLEPVPEPQVASQTPVLFALPQTHLLPGLVGEILRLGNDRQSFRWTETDGQEMALLRVLGPPYYALLRALERKDPAAPVAYLEQAARVWVEIGFQHPLAQQLRPPEGQMLLLRPLRSWRQMAHAPLRDIYELLEFPLSAGPGPLVEQMVTRRISVPLRLAPASSTDAELWVLREHAFDQVDELVRTSDEQLIGRLSFAVGKRGGESVIVVRVRPSRLPPPPLIFVGTGYRSYLKVPNLFLPCGARLQPPLRRDVLRQLLAADADLVTWLSPHEGGAFTPESLPDGSFRPLADWVDYVLEHERAPLEAWIAATTFDFESFICSEEQQEKAKKTPRRRHNDVEEQDDTAPPPTKAMEVVKKGKPPSAVAAVPLPEVPRATPSELQQKLHDLEQQFLALEGPLDDPRRQALWPELAGLNTALGHAGDAALCWMQALWQDESGARAWAQGWCQAERLDPAAPLPMELLNGEQATAPEARAVAAWLVANKFRSGLSPKALGTAQQFVERHEDLLPVRAVWLAAMALFHLSHGDVLGLARTRDRLLERLYQRGLAHDQDLPSFLRFSGIGRNERLRAFRDWLLELPARIEKWVHRIPFPHLPADADADPYDTNAYAELMLAFGLARLGEDRLARQLADSAKSWLSARGANEQGVLQDKVIQVLLDGFDARIHQALSGKPVGGPLPQGLLEYMARELDQESRYKVDLLRRSSRILEPHERIDAWRSYHADPRDAFRRDLVLLTDIIDRHRLQKECLRLLAAAGDLPGRRLLAVTAALKVAPRLGEEFALSRLAEVQALCEADRDVFEQAALLEQALFVAAHFNQGATVQQLLALLLGLLRANQDRMAHDPRLEPLVGQCFRGLRKLGLHDEIRQLLQTMTQLVTRGIPFESLRSHNAWSTMVRTLLHVAAGWFYFNEETPARRVLEEARILLFEGELDKMEKRRLACAYIATLAWGPVELALVAIDELLEQLDGIYDGFRSRTHFSVSKLEVVEAIVLAVVTEEFAMGQVARRWLEDDEYLVRRRIHEDLHAVLARTEAGRGL